MLKRQGFTLIELLVVVVIIGILASVALPSFVGAQDKARNSAVTSNMKTVKLALEQYATDNNGTYPEPPSWLSALAGGGGASGSGKGGSGKGKGKGKKKGCGDDCMDGLEEYLPGGELPKSPWSSEGAEMFAKINDKLTKSKDIVEGTATLTPKDTKIADAGQVPDGPAYKVEEYGAISYQYTPAATTYVLYATGKKGKAAIVAAADSNAGQ